MRELSVVEVAEIGRDVLPEMLDKPWMLGELSRKTGYSTHVLGQVLRRLEAVDYVESVKIPNQPDMPCFQVVRQ